jgi:hypothetical protein
VAILDDWARRSSRQSGIFLESELDDHSIQNEKRVVAFERAPASVQRIFLSLAVFSTLLFIAAFVLGLAIDADQHAPTQTAWAGLRNHSLTALAALIFGALVHAIVLTYFMGTGRWIEETSHAYRLPEAWMGESRSLKYRTIPAMVVSLVLLILTGASGAAVDPGSSVDFRGWGPLSATMIHFLLSATTLGINVLVNIWEYLAIQRNHVLIQKVLQEVRRMREERGLPL